MTKKLEDKIAIVTGGNSGIGEATGKVLAGEGAKVALLARRQEKGQTVQDEIRGASGEATFFSCDVSNHLAVEEAIAQVVERYGGVDILVNNAGGGALGGKAGEPMRLEDNQTWDRVISANLTGPFYMTRAVWPHNGIRRWRSDHQHLLRSGGRRLHPETPGNWGRLRRIKLLCVQSRTRGVDPHHSEYGGTRQHPGKCHSAATHCGQTGPSLARRATRAFANPQGPTSRRGCGQDDPLPLFRGRPLRYWRNDGGGRRVHVQIAVIQATGLVSLF
jgi:hypothetical protein